MTQKNYKQGSASSWVCSLISCWRLLYRVPSALSRECSTITLHVRLADKSGTGSSERPELYLLSHISLTVWFLGRLERWVKSSLRRTPLLLWVVLACLIAYSSLAAPVANFD